jgi:diguanylate cyclase (GGDEF)-like protein
MTEILYHPPAIGDEAGRLAALQSLDILDTGPEHRFDRLSRMARLALDVPIALVSLIDRDRVWFKSRHGIAACESDRSVAFCSHAIAQDGPFIVSDMTKDARFAENPFVVGDPLIRAYVGIPLRLRSGHAIGTLCVMDTQPRFFSDEEVDVMQDLASMVVETIELRHMASTDALTGALTRRGFAWEMDREFARARRFRKEIHLLAFDLDHFKAVNDRYGHAVGDVVLRTLVTTIREETRSTDLLARTGGEEFVLALPDTDRLGAQIAAERIRTRIAAMPIDVDGRSIRVTTSVGLAGCDLDQLGWTDALTQADIALYRAKRNGRNLTICYENMPGSVAA